MAFENGAEEHLCNFQIAACVHFLTRDRAAVHRQIAIERAQDLRDLRIGVFSLEDILFFAEDAVEEVLFVKTMGGKGVRFFAREREEIVKAVVHAAVFHGEHLVLHCLIPGKDASADPIAEPLRRVKRGSVLRKAVDIDDALQDLVHRVPRHPGLRHDVEFVPFHVVELGLRAAGDQRRAPQETAPGGFLAVGKGVGHTSAALQEEGAAFLRKRGMRAHLRDRRQIVPQRVPANEAALPAAVAYKRGSDARVFIKTGKQAPFFQGSEVVCLFHECVYKIGIVHANRRKGERLQFCLLDVHDMPLFYDFDFQIV